MIATVTLLRPYKAAHSLRSDARECVAQAVDAALARDWDRYHDLSAELRRLAREVERADRWERECLVSQIAASGILARAGR
jgi:hypothetical protein